MDDEVNETPPDFSRLSNEDLDEIAQARYAQYNSEAVRSAREELHHRGLNWEQRAAAWAASLERPGTLARPSGWWWKVWPTLCALAGFAIMIGFFESPRIQGPKPIVYLTTIGFDLIALGFVNDFRLWSERSTRAHMRAVAMVVLASFLTLWAFLCLIGLVNY